MSEENSPKVTPPVGAEPALGRGGGKVVTWTLAVALGGLLLHSLSQACVRTALDPRGVRAKAARLDIKGYAEGLRLFETRHHRYPTTAEGLEAVNDEGLLRKGFPKTDPWGHAYVYRCPGTVHPDGYDLLSFGADGKAGGKGEDADISN